MNNPIRLMLNLAFLLIFLLHSSPAGAAGNASFLDISWSDTPSAVEAKLKKAGIFVPFTDEEIKKGAGSPHRQDGPRGLLMLLHSSTGDRINSPLKDLPAWNACPDSATRSMQESYAFKTSGLTIDINLTYSKTEPQKKLLWYDVRFRGSNSEDIKDSLVSKYGDPLSKKGNTLWKVGTDYIFMNSDTVFYLNAKEITSHCEAMISKSNDSSEKVKKGAAKLF